MCMCVFGLLVHVKFRSMVAFFALFWQQYPPAPPCPVPPSCLFSHSSAFLPVVSVSVQSNEISAASEAFETAVFLLVWNCLECTHSHLQPASQTYDILYMFTENQLTLPVYKSFLGWFFCCTQCRHHVKKSCLLFSPSCLKSLIHGGSNTETEHYSEIKVDLELLPHHLAQAAGKAKRCGNGWIYSWGGFMFL